MSYEFYIRCAVAYCYAHATETTGDGLKVCEFHKFMLEKGKREFEQKKGEMAGP